MWPLRADEEAEPARSRVIADDIGLCLVGVGRAGRVG